jgi:hypothetical protein
VLMKRLNIQLLVIASIILFTTNTMQCMEKEEKEEFILDEPITYEPDTINSYEPETIYSIQKNIISEIPAAASDKEFLIRERTSQERKRARENIQKVNNLSTLIMPLIDKEDLIAQFMELAIETEKPTSFTVDNTVVTFYAPDKVLLGTGEKTQEFKMRSLLEFIDLLKEERKKKQEGTKKKTQKKPCASCNIS